MVLVGRGGGGGFLISKVVLGSVQDPIYPVTCGRTVVLRSGGEEGEEGRSDFDVILVKIVREGA